MKVSSFDFDLPIDLIADRPADPRDSARLLHINNPLSDLNITDFPSLLKKGDLLVFNDTKVIAARLRGKRGDANIEITLHQRLSHYDNQSSFQQKLESSHEIDSSLRWNDKNIWSVFAKPAKKLHLGDVFTVSDDFYAEVIDKKESGEVILSFNKSGDDFYSELDKHGVMPLPPYISKKRKENEDDKENYQTIYAKELGAVAAPTAGLHFTEEIFKQLEKQGVSISFVTLHVGAGTFLPVKVDDTDNHKMHSEWCSISEETANLINKTKKNGGRIIAVGTTSLRTLESAADDNGFIKPYIADTDIFITPGYKFKIIDLLFTNFHIPKSTLFMLVCAFAGEKTMKNAYAHAIDEKYRFYSYGDACLLEKN